MPDAVDSSTTNINSCEQTTTPIPQNQQHQQAKIFATRLYKMTFVDSGCFLNAITEEKEHMTALSMLLFPRKVRPVR